MLRNAIYDASNDNIKRSTTRRMLHGRNCNCFKQDFRVFCTPDNEVYIYTFRKNNTKSNRNFICNDIRRIYSCVGQLSWV